MIDRSREGEPIPPMHPDRPPRPHRHGPASQRATAHLRRCSCGEIGTYSGGTWRRAGWLRLWWNRKELEDTPW